MESSHSISHLIDQTFRLNRYRTLVQVRVQDGRVEIHDLRPLLATLQTAEVQQLRELRQMFEAGDVQVMERRPNNSRNATLRVHGRVREEIEALPQEAAKVIDNQQDVNVAVESDDHVAWRVSQVSIELLFDELIAAQEQSQAQDKGVAATTSTATRKRKHEISETEEATTTQPTKRNRDTTSRTTQEAIVAKARKQEADIRDKEREDTEEQEQRESLEKSRALRREAQGLGLSNPVKMKDASESAVEKDQNEEPKGR